MDDPAHLKVLQDLSQPSLFMDSAAYTKSVMQQIEEQQQLVRDLGLGPK